MSERMMEQARTVAKPRETGTALKKTLKKALEMHFLQTGAPVEGGIAAVHGPAAEPVATYRMPLGGAALNQVRFQPGRART